jgi:hypothetical protein
VKLAPPAPQIAGTPQSDVSRSASPPAAERQTADPQAAAETPSTTIHKADGSIVTVYHAAPEKVPGTAVQPSTATRRQLLQSSTLKKNPLR